VKQVFIIGRGLAYVKDNGEFFTKRFAISGEVTDPRIFAWNLGWLTLKQVTSQGYLQYEEWRRDGVLCLRKDYTWQANKLMSVTWKWYFENGTVGITDVVAYQNNPQTFAVTTTTQTTFGG